jgi:hypothetical protein
MRELTVRAPHHAAALSDPGAAAAARLLAADVDNRPYTPSSTNRRGRRAARPATARRACGSSC